METAEKLDMVKLMLGNEQTLNDDVLTAYLIAAAREIIMWRFDGKTTVTEVPPEYEMTQVHAVVIGFSQRGAEGQTWHSENGTMRTFHYDDMLAYIRANVVQMVGVPQ